MTRQPFPGGWYADCVPFGSAVLIPDQHILTHDGTRPLPPAGNALFLVCAFWKGAFVMACQGHQDGQAWLWTGQDWKAVGPTYGTSPVAFGPLGLYVSTPATAANVRVFDPILGVQTYALTQPIGARGFASVDAFGIHPQDEWYGAHGLAEYVDLHDAIYVGQGVAGGCVIQDRLLEPGNVQFVRAHRDGETLTVAMWKPDEQQAVCHWLTVADIALLPPVVVTLPPEPPIETPKPPVPPEKPPVPPIVIPPVPPLKTTQRYWLGPNIDSDVPAAIHGDLATVDVFELPVQWILEDARYDRLDTLKAIRAQGVNYGVGMGSIKPGDYHAESAQSDLPKISQRVLAKGHRVCYLTMDEPLTGAMQAYDANGKLITLDHPVQSLEESAFAIAKFVEKARATMPGVKVVWAEACPQISLDDQRRCLMILDSWGCHLDGWHLDMDWHRAQKEGLNPYDIIRKAKQYADDYKVPLGVYLVGYSHATDDAYFSEVMDLADRLHTEASWCIDHVLVQAWAARTGTNRQDLPANFGEFGLFPLFGHVQEDIFQ